MRMKTRVFLFAMAMISLASAANATVAVGGLFSDHTVLQRDMNVNVWGWGNPGENVSVQFGGQNLSAVTDDKGKWSVKLAPMKANSTPQNLTVIGKNVSAAVDRFGIKMLRATVRGGREWFNCWDAGPERTITWGPDSHDPQFMIRGSTRCVVYGAAGANAGQVKVSGSGPRLYVRGTASEAVSPPPGTPTWNNVEVTFYARTTNAGSKVVYAGLEAVCKTNHCPDSDDPTTRGYGGRVLFDGRVDIEKELSHGKGSNIRSFPAFIWTEADGGLRSANASLVSNNNGRPVYELPLNKWIGCKLVARNCDHGINVLLEVYIDRSGGSNGGDWKLAKSLNDIVYSPSVDALYFSKDLWYDGGDFKHKGSATPAQHGMPITQPSHSVYLRTDGNVEQYYKWFSVREVEPAD